ncbi:helix-turn-helix domain-containing protein [Lacticaseibacillus absianus]|uniref:helix-turn-helix domain-containing protein n=1 Tax=Lacticaseibacillus absianus TaxID=2729623 RepID=UPI0015CB0C9F|nr:helix-turn-helix transcriptional regulator [Lacticaseibacillus absianus]
MWCSIKKILERQGIDAAELSKRAGYKNNSTIYAIKSGQNKDPKLSTVIRIADALGVSLDELRPIKTKGEEENA